MSTDWYAPNQQAVRADGSGPAEEGTGGTPGDPESQQAGPQAQAANGDELDGLTKDELLELAEARGIEVNTSMTKAEIREAIEAG